jgi:hypothetical protein
MSETLISEAWILSESHRPITDTVVCTAFFLAYLGYNGGRPTVSSQPCAAVIYLPATRVTPPSKARDVLNVRGCTPDYEPIASITQTLT